MARRSFSKPSETQATGDRPTLEAVLDHYGIPHGHRSSQMIRCPIQADDHTPSFSINLDKQLFKCHSCGEAGDAWTLIMTKEGTDFDGARSFAAAHNLTDGNTGGGSVQVRGRYDRASGTLSSRKGSHSGDSSYTPAWRRRRSNSGA